MRRSSAVQSSLYDDYGRRAVIPLVKASTVGIIANPRLNPTFKIKNIAVVLRPLEIVSVPVSVLGEPVASLKADAQRVIGSLDDLLLRVDPQAGSRRHSRLMKPTQRRRARGSGQAHASARE
jgi:hypothetical protein